MTVTQHDSQMPDTPFLACDRDITFAHTRAAGYATLAAMENNLRASEDELIAWLRLTLEPDLGPAQARMLLAALGLPQLIYESSLATLAKYLPMATAISLHQPIAPEISERVKATLTWLEKPDHHVLTLADPHYPAALLALHDPPLLLYVNGKLSCLQQPALAVVGARNATPGGLENARAFSRHLAERGWCVVSGLAHGIDAAAHEGALQAGASGGGTIAVMATGIDIVYPGANLKLAHRIVENGALITEYPLGTPSLPYQFPQRNRIVAGLTQGVLVVEAARQSGSLITARLASEIGREVFAIPGSIHSPLSRGCHALIRQGAKLVESGQDIDEEMGAPKIVKAPSPTTQAKPKHEEDPILQALGYDPVDIDTLLGRCKLEADELNAALTLLELDGCIERLADGRWQRSVLSS